MAEITRAVVEKIARLANVSLTENELGRFVTQLGNILDYIHTLNRLDTKGIPETAHALPMQNIWRPDDVKPGLSRDEALAAAPETQDGCFKVPRIIE